MKRDWTAARAKVEDEGACRSCGTSQGLQACHIVPRSRVGAGKGAEDPRNIVVLCATCHGLQHDLRLELASVTNREEQAYVVQLVGLGEAWRRLTNERAA